MINIIPKPNYVQEKTGTLSLSAQAKIYADEKIKEVYRFCSELVFQNKAVQGSADDKDVYLKFNRDKGKEEYEIVCTEKGITVEASCVTGAFYAVQTLRQIVFSAEKKENTVILPCFTIKDKPRYCHRGLLIDESRHFFGMDVIKRLIDLMAMYKLNILHWHLSDDQGWRVEIKKFPLLTQIGSVRKDSSTNGWNKATLEGKPHSGFYTQENLKEIVKYAADRGITIIPEIDMPAHFAAAMAAYNYLGCREIPCQVHWFCGAAVPNKLKWTDWNRSACPGKETTYDFVFGVIDELAEIFPAPYFHIGGDEAPKDEWKKCPHCQKKMKEEGLPNVESLQGYFNNRVAAHLKEKGKNLIVWNEALSANNLDSSVIGQYWTVQKDKNVKKHIEKGGKVILSKHQSFYFDMGYNQYPLKNTYNFEAAGKLVDEKHMDSVLGIEGALWTEWVADTEKLEMQLFPRMQALSEVAWTERGKKNFHEFMKRVHINNEILDSLNVNYAVDKVSCPKNLIKRRTEITRWYYEDQQREVRLNRELKAKKQ